MSTSKMSLVVIITTYTYLICLAFCFMCSVINFNKHPRHLKVLSILLLLTIINECFAFWGPSLFKLPDNLSLYNVFIPIELTLYTLYFILVITLRWFKKFASTLLIVFPIIWYFCVIRIFSFQNWNSYISILESILIIFMTTVYYYQLFILTPLTRLKKLSEFWIATGLLIFYPCTLPFTGMLNYLLDNYVKYKTLATGLVINLQVFNIILYSLIAYSFLCRINIRKSLSLQ